jgi:hypothetical protein
MIPIFVWRGREKSQVGIETFLPDVEFEVFTAVVLKSIIFWDMTFLRNVGYNSTDYTASYPRR